MNGRMTGMGPAWGGSVVAGTDDGGSGIIVAVPPVPPEGPELGMNTGDGDLLLNVLL